MFKLSEELIVSRKNVASVSGSGIVLSKARKKHDPETIQTEFEFPTYERRSLEKSNF